MCSGVLRGEPSLKVARSERAVQGSCIDSPRRLAPILFSRIVLCPLPTPTIPHTLHGLSDPWFMLSTKYYVLFDPRPASPPPTDHNLTRHKLCHWCANCVLHPSYVLLDITGCPLRNPNVPLPTLHSLQELFDPPFMFSPTRHGLSDPPFMFSPTRHGSAAPFYPFPHPIGCADCRLHLSFPLTFHRWFEL